MATNQGYEQAIKDIAVFYDDPIEAEKLLRKSLPEDSPPHAIEAFFNAEFGKFYQRRVGTGTPHDKGKIARPKHNEYEQAIRRMAVFYDDSVKAEELLRRILPMDSHAFVLDAFYNDEYTMFRRRVQTGTPHSLVGLEARLAEGPKPESTVMPTYLGNTRSIRDGGGWYRPHSARYSESNSNGVSSIKWR